MSKAMLSDEELSKLIPAKPIDVKEVLNRFPDITENNFDIKECLSKGMTDFEAIAVIQHFYGLNFFTAMEMLAVVAYGKKPVDIVVDENC